MQNTTEVMVASMLMEGAVTGESLNKIIKEWRKRGCTIPLADEKAIVANFGRRQGLDALKIQLLHFTMDYARTNAKDPELFKNLTPVRKVDVDPFNTTVQIPKDGEDGGGIL